MSADGVPTAWSVLANDEEQYALFPADQDVPSGWRPTGFTGTEDECAAHVDRVWTDLRPASLRRAMAGPDRAAEPAP